MTFLSIIKFHQMCIMKGKPKWNGSLTSAVIMQVLSYESEWERLHSRFLLLGFSCTWEHDSLWNMEWVWWWLMKAGFHNVIYLLVTYQWADTKMTYLEYVNSLWPSNAIWQHSSGSTLAQVMACCHQVTSHYLNKCWGFTSDILRHPPKYCHECSGYYFVWWA